MKRLYLSLLLLGFGLQPLGAQSQIFLVRHAEKAQGGDTRDPDLSEAGRKRAESLRFMLRDAGITAIYATEYKRTQQTAEPLTRALGLEITIVPAKEIAALVAKLKVEKGNVLVVAHSNTTPEILKALGATDPPAIDEADYDNLFVLVVGPPAQLVRLHYR